MFNHLDAPLGHKLSLQSSASNSNIIDSNIVLNYFVLFRCGIDK